MTAEQRSVQLTVTLPADARASDVDVVYAELVAALMHLMDLLNARGVVGVLADVHAWPIDPRCQQCGQDLTNEAGGFICGHEPF